MKRVFGMFEIIFDILYLVTAFILGLYMVVKGDSQLSIMAGIMAIVLSAGDSFHLIPRIMVIKTCQEDKWRKSLGIGKQITSISMTIFYLPVVIWANKNPKIGMLMFPKTCAYLWLIIMCLGL